jgi:hypothetical protein
MRKLAKFALGASVALLAAGAGVAAKSDKHVMNVALPDGSTAHIEYYGDIAPKVTVAPSSADGFRGMWGPMAMPAFPDIDRMIERMERQREAMMRQMRRMPRAMGPGATANVASYGSLPAGANSVSVVSVSNGAGTCTRTTEVTSQGAGKPPKVVTNVSGNCSAEAAPAPQAKPTASQQAAGPIDRT